MYDTLMEVFSSLASPERLAGVLVGAGHILLILLAANVGIRLVHAGIGRLLETEDAEPAWTAQQRARTLAGLLRSVTRYAIDLIALVAILERLGVPTGTLLAGVGVASLAVGFGAQNLVRDIIAGFFILFENQFGAGDYVEVGGVAGIVEELGLRVTQVRDFGGQLHIIPNGGIERVTNYSHGEMRVMFTVDVAYEEDIDRAIEMVQQTLDRAASEVEDIVEGPTVLGVQELASSGVTLLIWGKARPMTQWAVTRELRLRIKRELDAAGIQIPYPRTVLVPPTATKIGLPIQHQPLAAPAAGDSGQKDAGAESGPVADEGGPGR